jgi:hydrogenase maturation protease
LPPEVEVIDFGISSYDLAYAITDAYDTIILVDAMPRGEPAGTVSLIEPDLAELHRMQRCAPDAHSMNPISVLQLTQSLGGVIAGKLLLVGCEPAVLESEDGEIGLSEPVRAAVPKAIGMIESIIANVLGMEMKTNAGLAPA